MVQSLFKDPDVLARVSALGSGTRCIAVYEERWGAPAGPLCVYLHAVGGSGFVAFGGLLEIGKLQRGEQVFVSTAAGAVCSIAVQVA